MFTKKPEPGESVTKLGGGLGGDMKTPFTERPATYAAKSPNFNRQQNGSLHHR